MHEEDVASLPLTQPDRWSWPQDDMQPVARPPLDKAGESESVAARRFRLRSCRLSPRGTRALWFAECVRRARCPSGEAAFHIGKRAKEGSNMDEQARRPLCEREDQTNQSQEESPGMTACFRQSYAALPQAIQQVATRKIALLTQNPAHPSLNVHRVRRARGLWECAITFRYRLLFERDGASIRLIEIGPHTIIDHVHHRRR